MQMSRDVASMTPDNWAFMVCDQKTHDMPILKNDWESYARTKAPVYTGQTLEEAAKAAGIDAKTLQKTVEDFNKAVAGGDAGKLTPPNTRDKAPVIDTAPFYIVPFQGGMTATFGGPLINTKAEIQSLDGGSIPGLYAAGNAAGGIFFFNYAGGAQLGAATVYGRIAGRELANRAKQN